MADTAYDLSVQQDIEELRRIYAETEQLRARNAGITPPSPPPPASEPFWTSRLPRYAWRGLEAAGEMGHAAAKFPLGLAKLPAAIEEYATGSASPLTERIRQAARNVDTEIGKGVEYFGQKAGHTPLREMGKTELPVVGEVSAATPFRAAGNFLYPAPAIKSIPRLFSREAIKPALEGMGKMGAFSGGVQAMEEMDRPPEERDWWNVPKAAAQGAVMTPLFQRAMGIGHGKTLPPGAEHVPGDVPPPAEPVGGLRVKMPTEEELALYLEKPEVLQPGHPSTTGAGGRWVGAPVTEPIPPVVKAPEPPAVPEGLPPKPGQQEIPVPPPTIGERPIIGREATPEEAPLFSKAAQMPAPEQMTLDQPTTIPRPPVQPTLPPVSESTAYGPSLADFLRSKGGVMDQGGELGKLEMRNKPFQKGLIKPNGMGLDTAAELAHQAGYLPERDINGLLKALDAESRGRPAFAPGNLNPAKEGELFAYQEAKRVPFQGPTELPSTQDIHSLADARGIPWDNNQQFMDITELVTGKSHLDDLTPQERTTFYNFLKTVETETPNVRLGPRAPQIEELPLAALKEEMPRDVAQYNKTADLLNDERGSINLTLGQGVGPIQKILTARRVAELHPQDFKPVYEHTQQRMEFVNAQKYDLNHLAEPFFRLSEKERGQVSDLMRMRRRLGRSVIVPPALQPAVASLDRMFGSAADLINSVREAKGLPAMPLEDFYVPFSRSGDYLVVMEGPKGTVPRWVSAAETLREAESIAKTLQSQHPQGSITIKTSSGKKGDKPALDFGTLGMLQKAGLLGPDEYEKAIKQFGLPPGFSEHFQRALKTFGEATDITDPVQRYVDGVTNYAGRALYDDTTKQLVSTIKDPQVRQYAEKYQQYINEKPVEYSRLRGATAVYDLALNVGSMLQNASQVPVIGIPVLQSHMGSVTKAANLLRKGMGDVLHPDKPVTVQFGTASHTYKPSDLLQAWTRAGDVRPVNAEELFGVVKGEQTGVEFGSPSIQRLAERGALSPEMAGRIRRPIDFLANQFEQRYQQFQDLNQAAGKKMSYGLSRLTGKSPQESTQKALQAHGILMQGFAWIEEKNRAMALLSGYRAGLEKGLSPQESFEFARTYSRDVNFDYSPASRAQAFRGKGAPLGLFMTFQTEALATYSKLLRAQLKNTKVMGKIFGPATTAILAYMTLGGMKGLPGPVAGFPSFEDVDTYGPKPGMMSENLPDWAWHGPASALTGTDIGSKFKMGARVPFKMGEGGLEFDPSQIAVAQPWVNLAKSAYQLHRSPGEASDIWKFGEGIAPPFVRGPMAASRWAGFGPAGALERGAVGTIKGHTPGPGEEGKREFFMPSPKDIAGKALSFTPLELSKQYGRGRIEKEYRDEEQGLTTDMVNSAARHLQRNGLSVPNENLRTLASEHPNTYRALMKAYRLWQQEPRGSVEQIYRAGQEPKKPAKR